MFSNVLGLDLSFMLLISTLRPQLWRCAYSSLIAGPQSDYEYDNMERFVDLVLEHACYRYADSSNRSSSSPLHLRPYFATWCCQVILD